MMIGKSYVDVMDPSRTVTPIDSTGLCRIHFDGTFVGKAPVPTSLFEPSGHNEYVGFVPADVVQQRMEEDAARYDEDQRTNRYDRRG